MTGRLVAAVDLGASSGRVMVGRVGPDDLELTEIHRFPNEPVRLPDGLHWDVLRLYREVLAGLREAARAAPGLVSVGLDSWAIDYGLLDERGALLGDPYHYRDERTAPAVEAVHAVVPPAELYARRASSSSRSTRSTSWRPSAGRRRLAAARTLLLIPDLIGYWLTGVRIAELTNASTTGLLDVHRRGWDRRADGRAGIPREPVPELAAPGDVLGPLRDDVQAEIGAGAARRWSRWSARTTRRRRSSAVPADERCRSRTSPAGRGRWSGSSSSARS